MEATDVAAGPENSFIIVSKHGGPSNFKIYKWFNNLWTDIGGQAVNIAIGELGRPYVQSSFHSIFWPINCLEKKEIRKERVVHIHGKRMKSGYNYDFTSTELIN
jgi:hypothetical protein